jgi:hypothetical protein
MEKNCMSRKKIDRRQQMRDYRERKAAEKLLRNNQCPVCSMLLNKEYQRYHKGCPYYDVYMSIYEY